MSKIDDYQLELAARKSATERIYKMEKHLESLTAGELISYSEHIAKELLKRYSEFLEFRRNDNASDL